MERVQMMTSVSVREVRKKPVFAPLCARYDLVEYYESIKTPKIHPLVPVSAGGEKSQSPGISPIGQKGRSHSTDETITPCAAKTKPCLKRTKPRSSSVDARLCEIPEECDPPSYEANFS